MINLSAPGKLFLIGEYAVLDGAPAILSAVDRRVYVTIERSIGRHWRIHAPDIGIDVLTLGPDGYLPDGIDPGTRSRLRVYTAVHAHVTQHIGRPDRALTIRINSNAFSHNGHKLGLGSSAALAGSLTAALAHAAGSRTLDRETLCNHAITAHRQAQNGSGSGADVATSIHGGTVEYQDDTIQAELSWPHGITGMAVVTGDGASTPDLVKRVRAYAEQDPTTYDADMGVLRKLAGKAKKAMANGDDFLCLMRDYFDALQILDRHAQAGIVLPRHNELAALAKKYSGVFKTSGAGGGDLGLAFSHAGEPAQRLAAALTEAKATIIPIEFNAQGLKID